MRKIVLIIMILAVSAAVYAEPVKFWVYLTGERKEILIELAKKYEQKSGNKVEVTWVPFDALQGKYTAYCAQDRGPDVIIGPADWIGAFEAKGIIQDVTAMSDKEDEKKYLKNVIDDCRFRGKLYGLPAAYHVVALVYNKDMIPVPPKTVSEMIKMGKKVTNVKKSIYGLVYDKKNYYYHAPWIGGFGGEIIDKNNNPTFDTPEQINAVKFVKSLQEGENLIMPEEIDYNVAMSLFSTNKAAMMINGPWMISQLRESKVNYGVARLPMVDATGEWPKPLVGAEVLMMWSGSKNKEKTFDFMRYMTSSQAQAELARYGFLPSKKEVYEFKSVKNSDYFIHLDKFREQAEVGVMMPLVPEMNMGIWGEGISMLNNTFSGEMEAVEAAKAAQKNASQQINKWRKENMEKKR